MKKQKKNKKHKIQFQAGRYITRLFTKKLPSNLLFHNFHHTANVVRGVRDIVKNLGLDKEQKEILLLAAWFHDSGHTICYAGHEIESQKIAKAFLEEKNYPEEKLEKVLSCIAATQMPQRPTTLLQQVICDADLYHLSLMEYVHLQYQLREEWQRILQKEFTAEEWKANNLTFLEQHHYFTSYGKDVLQERKLLNLEKCRELVEE